MVFRNSEGKELDVRATIFSLFDPSGQLCSFALNAALVEKLSSDETRGETYQVGARLRTSSHELNNRLAVIMGFAQLIMLDKRCQGSMRSHAEKAYAEIQRVVQLVEDLHHYALSLQKT
jgi:signal transduction histidine kinase